MRLTNRPPASRSHALVLSLVAVVLSAVACVDVDPFQTADTFQADTTLPDSAQPDTSSTDSTPPDSTEPEDTSIPDTTPVGPLVADRCDQAGPGVSTVPATVTGSTLDATDDYNTIACSTESPALGTLVPDATMRLELVTAGRYSATLAPDLAGDGGPTLLYLATGCGDGALTCSEVSHNVGDGSTWWFTLGEDIIGDAWLVFDGVQPADVGGFDLTLDGPCTPQCTDAITCGTDGCGGSCGECEAPLVCTTEGACDAGPVVGDACDDPFVLTSPGSSGANHTSVGGDLNSGTCSDGNIIGNGRSEHVWQFTATQEGTYTFTLEAEHSAAFYLKDNCSISNALACATVRDDTGAFTLRRLLTESQTVYAFVDGATDGPVATGGYNLAVSEACIADCTGRVCGDDGCGGSCGVCSGEQVCRDAFGTCEIVPGNACISPLDLDDLPPMTVTGDTSVDAQDTFSYVSGCPTGPTAAGGGAPDNVYRFVAPSDAVYTFTLVADFDARLYVASECEEPDGSCLGASAPGVGSDTVSVSLPLSSAQIYYIYVDGGGTAGGSYELTVSAACMPNCTDRTCGSDGCGTSCGACAVDQVCGAGNCVSLEGEGCGAPFAVNAQDLPTSVSESTAASLDAVGSCTEPGGVQSAQSPDQVWSFTPLVDGVYTVRLTAEFQAVLSIREGCADECIGGDVLDASGAAVTAPLMAGGTYFVVVDGQGGESGPYDLTFDAPCTPDCAGSPCGADGCGSTCGTCAPGLGCDDQNQCVAADDIAGNLCGSAIEITSAPFSVSMSTLVGSDDHSLAAGGCTPTTNATGTGLTDHFYAFTAPADGVYTAQVTSEREMSLSVYADCLVSSGVCFGSATGDSPSVDIVMTANETRIIVVDGHGAEMMSGSYELTLSPPCTPSCSGLSCGSNGCSGSCGSCSQGLACDQGNCGPAASVPGETCTTPIPVSELPFSYAGNTTWSSNSHSFTPGQCATISPGWGAGSPDNVFAFTPQTNGDYQISLTGNFDRVLYVAIDCADIGGSCVIGDDVLGNGPEMVLLSAVAGETYFVVVDGFSNSSAIVGDFELTIEAL